MKMRRIGKSVEFAVKLEILYLCYKRQGSFLRTEKKLKGRLGIHHLKSIDRGVFFNRTPETVLCAMYVQHPNNLKDNSILSFLVNSVKISQGYSAHGVEVLNLMLQYFKALLTYVNLRFYWYSKEKTILGVVLMNWLFTIYRINSYFVYISVVDQFCWIAMSGFRNQP